MMTQEEGFIEIKTNLWNRNRLTKWVLPVRIKRVKLLLDVYCWMFVSRNSDLDFTRIEDMDSEEFLTWAVFGGYMSYAAIKNKKPRLSIQEVEDWVKGILMEDRVKILETIQLVREVGETHQSYQKAMLAGEDDGPKKVDGSDQKS